MDDAGVLELVERLSTAVASAGRHAGEASVWQEEAKGATARAVEAERQLRNVAAARDLLKVDLEHARERIDELTPKDRPEGGPTTFSVSWHPSALARARGALQAYLDWWDERDLIAEAPGVVSPETRPPRLGPQDLSCARDCIDHLLGGA